MLAIARETTAAALGNMSLHLNLTLLSVRNVSNR